MSDMAQRLAALTPEQRALLEAQLKKRGQTFNTFPLSYAQQRLWLLDQLQPGNTSYNLMLAFRLRGALDVAALERAITTLVERHEVLRTVYPTVRGQPVQAVMPAAPVALPLLTLPAEGDRERGVQELINREGQHVFDLEHGPMVRFTLAQAGADDHALLVNMHHICSDGWSLSILTRELAALYAAYHAGQPSPLSPLAIQYADYAAWQRDPARAAEQAQELAYWRERLRDAPPFLELPTDYARPAVQTSRSETHVLRMPKPLVERLQALGQQERATLFMTLLAAFQVLLARLTDEPDVVVGTPIANRNRAETEDLIGFFVNTLVLRANLADDPTARVLVRRVRDDALGAYAHQDVSFDRLLEEINPTRDLSHPPIFQVLFNMANTPAMEVRWGDLAVTVAAPEEGGAKFDMTLYLQEDDAGITLELVANADLFSSARMQEFLRQYVQVAEQMAQQPDAPTASFSLVTPTAAAQLPDPGAPLSDAWVGSIHEVIAGEAARAPDRLALHDATEQWRYGELDQRANQLAHWLGNQGIGRGDVVAISAHRSASLVWAILGTLKAGAAYTILDPAYPEARLLDYVAQAQPRALVSCAHLGPLPAGIAAHFDAATGRSQIALPTLAEAAGHPLAAQPTHAPTVTMGPDDVATISFTSGSTGRPKGIAQRHGSLTHFLAWQRETVGLVGEDRHTLLSGLAHDPLQRDLFTTLASGAALYIPDPEQLGMPGYLARWMRDHAITVTNLTPAMIQLVTQVPASDAALTLPALRRAITVGDALKRHDVARLWDLAPNVVCINYFGSTETQRAISYYIISRAAADATGPLPKEVIPIGRGARDVQLLLLNANQQLAGIGEIGEIVMRSPHLAAGYLHDPDLTRARFVANPFTGAAGDRMYRTGDLGRYLPDGNAEYVARRDQQVKIRGFRIELGEIEAALRAHPTVREAVVIAHEQPPHEKQLVAYVVPAGAALTVEALSDLRRHLGSQLPSYMVPAHLIGIAAIPLTPNGKLDRRALPSPDAAAAPIGALVLPRTPREAQVAQLWQEVLGRQTISVEDNFFDLGGHSLLATQLVARLIETMGITITLRQLFEAPTIATMAELLDHPITNGANAASQTPLTRIARP